MENLWKEFDYERYQVITIHIINNNYDIIEFLWFK